MPKLQYGLIVDDDGLWLRLVLPSGQTAVVNVGSRTATRFIDNVVMEACRLLRAHEASEVHPVQIAGATTTDRIDLQNREFDAVEELSKQWKRLQMTPPVDDDYPAVRHDYEGALRGFLAAAKANGRTMP